MNILQLEDQIKGLPDNRLIEEAKAPSGQLPQYLLISEVQRRTDMRKRYEADQQQNEGTVADQILNGGIGSIQRPPEGQGMPQPNMPQQLPQGPGIAQPPGQFPPTQDPNAAMYPPQQQPMMPPQGMAGGGLTSLPYMVAGHGRPMTEDDMAPQRDKKAGDWYDPAVKGISRIFGGGGAERSFGGGIADLLNDITAPPEYAIPGYKDAAPEMRELMTRDWAAQRDAETAGVAGSSPVVPQQTEEQKNQAAIATLEEMEVTAKKKPNPQKQGYSNIQKQAVPDGRNNEYDQMLKQQREAAWSNALIQLGAGIAGGDLSKGLSAAGTSMSEGQRDIGLMQREKLRQDAYESMNSSTAAQRADQFAEEMAWKKKAHADEMAAGKGRNYNAGIAENEWFISQPASVQNMILTYKGKELPSERLNNLVIDYIAKVSGTNGAPPEPEDIAKFRAAITQVSSEGNGLRKVITQADYDAVESGEQYLHADGSTRTKP